MRLVCPMWLFLQVWAVDLVLFQCLPHRYAVGEAWINPASWMQLFGFSLLLAGTIIYAQAHALFLMSTTSCMHIVHGFECKLKGEKRGWGA